MEVESHKRSSDLDTMQDLEIGRTWVDRLKRAMNADNCRTEAFAYDAYYRKTSVFKVPHYMYSHPYPEAFKPQQFRLGLFQHDDSDEVMDSTSEKIKRRFATVVASQCRKKSSGSDSWSWFVDSVGGDDKDVLVDTWRCANYDDSVELPDETVVPHRLALDAVFVLVVLCDVTFSPSPLVVTPSPFFRQAFKDVVREGGLVGRLGYFFADLMLVENQIPMEVLNEVNRALHSVYDEKGHSQSLDFAVTQAVVGCFPFICDRRRLLHHINHFPDRHGPQWSIAENKHILDGVYLVMCGHDHASENSPQSIRTSVWVRMWNRLTCCQWRSGDIDNSDNSTVDELYRVLPASKLAEAGIVVQPTAMTLGDVRFESKGPAWRRPSLRLPKVKITSNTVAMFRNLGLYEQLCYPDRYTVRSYLQLMDQLVDTKEDVEVLSKRGVFVNLLSNDEKAAEMWNHMYDGLCDPIHSEAWHQMIESMSKHYTKLVHGRWYEFRRSYFDSSRPWVIGGSLLFVVVTLCTIASTVIDLIGVL